MLFPISFNLMWTHFTFFTFVIDRTSVHFAHFRQTTTRESFFSVENPSFKKFSMSDLESGNFLYENRDRCNQIATLQVFIFSLSFVFTYQVWWCGITGIGLGLLGYFASSAPVVQNKVKLMTIVSIKIQYWGMLKMSSIIMEIGCCWLDSSWRRSLRPRWRTMK